MNSNDLKDKTVKNPSFWTTLGAIVASFIAGDKTQGFSFVLQLFSAIFGG
ncbi:MAG: hypothetical protein LBB59_00960 [Campylobacteraceae bacterium]|jgi:hypothetical protein|nr:hypothetical protein [Campylobacteraceae bacterium]